MKITPLSITLQGFKSFSSRQTFHFPHAFPALCSIGGQNQAEPELGANAAGKSTLWSGLFYCLFGKSERGLSTGDLHSWNTTLPLQVRFDFLIDGKPAYIERTPKPTITIIKNEGGIARQVSQKELEDWLGLGPETFQQAVFVGQFSPMFLDMGPGEKQAFLSELMDLDRWEDYRRLADKDAKDLETRGIALQAKQTLSKTQLDACQREYAQHQLRSREWDTERNARLAALYAERTQAQMVLDTMKATKEAFVTAFKVEDVSILKVALDKLTEEDAAQTQEGHSFDIIITEHGTRVSILKAEYQKLNTLAVANYLCPTCGKQADAQHIASELERIKKEGKDYQALAAKTTDKKTKLTNKRKQNAEKRRSLEGRMETARRDQQGYERKVSSFDAEILKLQQPFAIIESRRTDIMKETNQFNGLARTCLEKIRIENEELVRMGIDVKRVAQLLGVANFWKRGFKEAQLFLLAEVVTQLEMAYNSALSSLGMPDWKIHIQVENETKSNTIQNKFLIHICPPGVDKPIPWEAWSGGESQRLRLACAFGTFDLVAQLTGVTWDFEVWDEPTQHLSEEGTESLLNILRQRAMLLNKQVFLIDHTRVQYGNFDYQFRITKTSDGSHIEY